MSGKSKNVQSSSTLSGFQGLQRLKFSRGAFAPPKIRHRVNAFTRAKQVQFY